MARWLNTERSTESFGTAGVNSAIRPGRSGRRAKAAELSSFRIWLAQGFALGIVLGRSALQRDHGGVGLAVAQRFADTCAFTHRSIRPSKARIRSTSWSIAWSWRKCSVVRLKRMSAFITRTASRTTTVLGISNSGRRVIRLRGNGPAIFPTARLVPALATSSGT
jgi:hypothetical protein